jgi:hypothetical protein
MIFQSKLNITEGMSISDNVTEVTKIIRNECLKRLEQTELRTSNEFNYFF